MISDFTLYSFAAVLFGSLFFIMFGQIIIRVTLDRRVREALPKDKRYNFVADWYFGYGRTIIFAYASCFDWANESWVIQDYYDGFNVKGFANRFEKLVGFLITLGTFGIISSVFLYYFTKWTGLLTW